MIVFNDGAVYLGDFRIYIFDDQSILPQEIVYTSRQGLMLYTHRIDIRLA